MIDMGIGDWAQSPIPNPHNPKKICLNKGELIKIKTSIY